MSPVRAKFRCRVGVGRYNIRSVQYKTITLMEVPTRIVKQVCVCVCVCVSVSE